MSYKLGYDLFITIGYRGFIFKLIEQITDLSTLLSDSDATVKEFHEAFMVVKKIV